MLAFAFIVLSSTFSGFIYALLIEALKDEAPDLYAKLGKPSIIKLFFLHQFPRPFTKHILSSSYRTTLANYPRSRAWASWALLAHRIEIAALVVFIGSLFYSPPLQL